MPKGTPDEERRPKRKAPPKRLKVEIFARQGGRCYLSGKRLASIWDCEWHHMPPLGTRPILPDGSDYDPPQLHPDYLFAAARAAHDVSTNGPDVEKRHLLAANHDKGKVSRTKRLRDNHREHLAAMKEKKPGTPRPRSGRWPKRPLRSRPFDPSTR